VAEALDNEVLSKGHARSMKASRAEESELESEDRAAHGHLVQYEDPLLTKDMAMMGVSQGILCLGKSFSIGFLLLSFFVCILSAPCLGRSINC
jgi:hypothetical protein